MAARATDHAAEAAFNAAVVLASRAFRVPRSRIVGTEGQRNSTHDDRVVLARRSAVYLAVVSCDNRLRAVGRAARLSHVAVIKALRHIEDRRDDPQFDARLSRLEQELMA